MLSDPGQAGGGGLHLGVHPHPHHANISDVIRLYVSDQRYKDI